jgi:hypothetical protein
MQRYSVDALLRPPNPSAKKRRRESLIRTVALPKNDLKRVGNGRAFIRL